MTTPILSRLSRPAVLLHRNLYSNLPRPLYASSQHLHHRAPPSHIPRTLLPPPSPLRTLHTSRPAHHPTTIHNILEDPEGSPIGLRVKNVSSDGIQLVSGELYRAPIVFIGGQVFLWKVPRGVWSGRWVSGVGGEQEEWERWWGLFEVCVPKPEILLFGTGRTTLNPPPSLMSYFKNNLGLRVDVFDTRSACSTYNMLIEEGRDVAAALIPLKPGTWDNSMP